MTIKILRSQPQPEQVRKEVRFTVPSFGDVDVDRALSNSASMSQPAAPSSLTAFQLSTVLSSLCRGLPQAAHLYQTSPFVIQSWTLQHERGLLDRKWSWEVEKLVEELLSRREQQLMLSKESLLQAAREALGDDSQLTDRYSWTVDLMLRHSLSLQTSSINRAPLPRNIRQSLITFTQSLSSQVGRDSPQGKKLVAGESSRHISDF